MPDSILPSYTFDETRRVMAEGAQWLPGGASSDYRLGSSALVIDRGLSLIHIPSPRDRQKSRMPSSA